MIVNRLSRLIGDRRTNVSTVSRETGIARSSLHELYHNHVERVDLGTLNRLCKHFGVPVGELLEYVPEEAVR